MRGAIIFGLTYVLVSARRLGYLPLGRPGAALLGAVACVATGAVPANEALGAVDGATILLLFGMMGMGAFLELDGFADRLQAYLSRRVRTRRGLLAVVIWGAGIASALITNDAVCVLGAPLVVTLVRAHDLPPTPYLIALATASNTGSVATVVGNPQNMLCASLGGLEYREHLLVMGPLAIVCLAINHLAIAWIHRSELEGEIAPSSMRPSIVNRRIGTTLAVIGLTTMLYLTGLDLAWTAVAGFTALLVLHRRDATEVWPRIEWSVLLFFSGLFIVVDGLIRSGLTHAFFAEVPIGGPGGVARVSAIFLFGSNVVSNVPFILVVRDQLATLPHPKLGWELLAMASTFAGNLTLLGSVANIIVAERARELGGLGFRAHLKIGLPVALVTAALGTAWVAAFAPR